MDNSSKSFGISVLAKILSKLFSSSLLWPTNAQIGIIFLFSDEVANKSSYLS